MTHALIGSAKQLVLLLRRTFCESGVPPSAPRYETELTEGTYDDRRALLKEYGCFESLLTDNVYVREALGNIEPLQAIAKALQDVSDRLDTEIAPRFHYLFRQLCEMHWIAATGTVQDCFSNKGGYWYTLEVIDTSFLNDLESALDEISTELKQADNHHDENEAKPAENAPNSVETAATVHDNGRQDWREYRVNVAADLCDHSQRWINDKAGKLSWLRKSKRNLSRGWYEIDHKHSDAPPLPEK